jgi:hypothetical protein
LIPVGGGFFFSSLISLICFACFAEAFLVRAVIRDFRVPERPNFFAKLIFGLGEFAVDS